MKNLFFLLLFIEAAAFGQNFDESWIIRNIQEDNSKSNDYQPFMVDSIMIFTSDRGGKNKAYFSTWKHGTYEMRKDDYKWTLLNSSTTLVGTNDTHFFFRKNNDFYQAEKKDNPEKPWKIHRIKKLKNLNSDKDEQSLVCVNDTFYFSSKRNGSYNIYMKVGTGKENPVVPLDSLNSSYDEVDIFLSPDGQHLFFSSDRPGGIGGFDIYKSTKVSGVWGKPELLPKPINSFMSDRGFKAYNDTCIVFYSDRITRENAGKFDLYDVKKSYYATLSYRDSSERKIVVDKVHSEKKEELIPSDTSSVMEENPFVKKAKQVLEREIPVGEVFTDNTPIQEEPKIFKQEIPETVQQEIPKTIKDKQSPNILFNNMLSFP
ncbi:TPA: hypothetical protein DEP21_06515 [Patescibacteria group bacterium]|nr:hypothetical protein [Candidatus Gracilibacteria bacterium]